jgi:hypothetical protein
MKTSQDKPYGSTGPVDFRFPLRIACHGCGAMRRVFEREVYEMPEGVAGVALARCGKCRHTFVRFIGEKRAAARAMEMWLGIQHK